MPSSGLQRAEPFIAGAVAVLGGAATTWAAFTHTAPLIAPGATLILAGSAWLGNSLARRDVRLFRSGAPTEQPAEGEGR